jgi:hypothetical protein
MSVDDSSPKPPRVVVKIEPSLPGERIGHKAVCHTGTCSWTDGPHVVKAAAVEQAGWHRQQHRSGRIDSAGKLVGP